MKRITSLVLALVLLMCFLPGYAGAEEMDIPANGTLHEGSSGHVTITPHVRQFVFDFYPEHTGYYHFGHNSDFTAVIGTAGSDGQYIAGYYFDSVDGYTLWLEAGQHYYVIAGLYNDDETDRFQVFADYLEPKDSGWTELHGRKFFWEDGDLAEGWVTSDGDHYYINEMGYAYTNVMLQDEQNNFYIFDESGAMVIGWVDFGGYTYYAGPDGVLVSGWQFIDGRWYAFRPFWCDMYRNTVELIDGDFYCFDENGHYVVGWAQNGNQTYYGDAEGILVRGWQYIDGKYYYFDETWAYMCRNMVRQVGQNWYYFDDQGQSGIGWIEHNDSLYYGGPDGVLVTGWQFIDGKWYCFSSYGAFLYRNIIGGVDDNRYYFDENGQYVTGWVEHDGKTYYAGADGILRKGWQLIEGKWYGFHEDLAYMFRDTEGFIDGKEYYFDENGQYVTGPYGDYYYDSDGVKLEETWLNIDGKWYYYDHNGRKATGKKWIDDIWYHFDSDGVMLTGWVETENGKYYHLSNGAPYTGWLLYDGAWYYLDHGGRAATWWQFIDDKQYYFGGDGVMRSGWTQIDGNWYYFNSHKMTGWQQISGQWYYLDTYGVMQKSWQQIDGYWYYFGTDGAMRTGWVQDEGKWYYMSDDGVMRTDWQQVDGLWYYLGDEGAMQTGLLEIDGKTYYLNSEMKVGWQLIDGKWYYFANDMRFGWQFIGGTWYYLGDDGAMVTGSCEIDGTVYNFADNGAWIP